MFGATPLSAQSFSLVVRRMTMVFVGTFVFGTLALTFAANLMFGVSRNAQDMTVSTAECGRMSTSCPVAEKLVARAVIEQRASGLTCTTKPELTDVVLFQYADDQRVAILTFDEALADSGRKLGWVQRYCR